MCSCLSTLQACLRGCSKDVCEADKQEHTCVLRDMPTPGEKKEENICTIHTSSYITEIVIVSVPPGCNEVR